MATKNWSKLGFDLISLTDGVTSKWTASASGTNEYYYNQGDLNILPLRVTEDDTDLILGTLGSLAAGEYALGDNDSIGSDTIYVRLSDSTDPDAGSPFPVIKCTDLYTILTGGAGNSVVIVSTKASNYSVGTKEVQSMSEATLAENDVYVLSYNGQSLTTTAMPSTPATADLLEALTEGDNAETYAQMPFVLSAGTSAITITWKEVGNVDDLCTAVKTTGSGTPTVTQTTPGDGDIDFIVYYTDSSDVVYFQYGLTLKVTDGPFALDTKDMLNDEDKIKVMSSHPEFTIMFSGDES